MATPRNSNPRVIGVGLLIGLMTGLLRSTTHAQPPNQAPDIASWEIFDSDGEYRVREEFLRFRRSELDQGGVRAGVESLASALTTNSSPLPDFTAISNLYDRLALSTTPSAELGTEKSSNYYHVVKIRDSIKETRPSLYVEPPSVMLIHESLELHYEPDIATLGIRSNSKLLLHTFGSVFQPIPGSTFGLDWLRAAAWRPDPTAASRYEVSRSPDSPVIFTVEVRRDLANLPSRVARVREGEVIVAGRFEYEMDDGRGLAYPSACVATQLDEHNVTFTRSRVEIMNWAVHRDQLKIEVRGIIPLVDFRGREARPWGLDPSEWPVEIRRLVTDGPAYSGPVAESLLAVREKFGVPTRRP